ncbi:uncharacterized protein LOC123316362 [Coccinella septempunctata]|uniref:uncharacterized protein LOC123316362 n=1 Tax=Coccinella septempunctata TaxID=41139 RepID=UPI001D07AE17|nr:uncharacterized protein LOC123316362 [Coccinella septempunctata]
MDSLKEYLLIQRSENEALRNEIITKLEELFRPFDSPMTTMAVNPSRYSNFILEMCQFEQKMNHKLTEISFELKRFSKQNKYPVYRAPLTKSNTFDDTLDIDTLKANSSRLICKLDKLRENHCEESDTKSFLSSQLNDTSRVSFEDDKNIFDEHNSLKSCELPFCEEDDKFSQKPDISFSEPIRNEIFEDICPILSDVIMENINDPEFVKELEKNTDSIFSMVKDNEVTEFEDTDRGDKNSNSSILHPEIEEECKEDVEISAVMSMEETEKLKIVKSSNQCKVEKSIEPFLENSSKLEEVLNKTDSFLVKSESELSDIIWKNIIELGSMKPEEIQTYVESPENNSETSNIKVESDKTEKDHNDDNETRPDIKIQGSYELESEISSESENDSGVLPDSETSQEMKEDDVKCESKYSAVLEESKVEDSKPLFSAEEKIKKLGLDDRWTLFEKTRKVAKLPDLRLRPTLQNNETKNSGSKANVPLEIADSIVPALNTLCVFSHVESPSEFYLHPNIEEAKLIDSLNDLITEQYKKTKTPFKSKLEASENLGNFCCAYVKDDKMYYRAEIVDWLFEKSNKLVLVQLVDYGNYSLVHFKSLRRLTAEVSSLPKLAIRCYFPLLYPPGSTRNNLLTEWPKSSIEALFELSGLSTENSGAMFKIVYVQRESGETAIDLCQAKGQDADTIGQLLIDLGHAVQIVLPEDDPMGVLSDEEDIKNLERCDNLNEVILGYDPKDEARICKFTRRGGGKCFKRSCKLEHVEYTRGGFTTDQTLTYASALVDLKLPRVGESIAIRFTTFLEATRFYANLVCYVEELKYLEEVMNDSINCSKFETFKILPAYGEVVIVKHWQKRWLRAIVRHHLFNEDGNCTGAQVFMVDYGDIIDVPLHCIRQIRTEYLNLPFQAIECVLQNYRDSTKFGLKDMDRFFYENMVFRSFNAKVLAISDMQMCLEVYCKDTNLGDILCDYGFLERENRKIILPHPDSILIPG